MIIKTYAVNSIDEVQDLISRDLGPSASILHSKHVKPSAIQRFFGRKPIEVRACVEDDDYHLYCRRKQQLEEEVKGSLDETYLAANLTRLKNLLVQRKDEFPLPPPDETLVLFAKQYRDLQKKKVAIVVRSHQSHEGIKSIIFHADKHFIPLVVVEKEDDVEDALSTFADCDLVLISRL